MKKLVLPVLIVCSLLSCKDNTVSSNVSACGVNDPIRNLPWLKNLIEKAIDDKEANMLTVTLLEFKGRPILNYSTLYMSCYGCINYECDGSRVDISKFPEQELKEFQALINDTSGKKTILWPEK
ncbi:hypothetical protein [Dyadobacter sediminis]|uniref:Uncharacterized protein n=1 Tax=Dyadobacter sediminis TaxID=1493691 RepID=A0A5R9KJX1_9BACT|nr:hypothetical protein [Dyadobacter sediminis]TLU96502.1 hypothetical protein FEM55_05045 [Dyadobacter sediminis]GGB82737.1 hypothetical protein GCM10011325_07860 [Dyadobacter sediminis]